MKKLFYTLCFFALSGFVMQDASAAAGDTTWIQANNRRMDNGSGYGNYDTTITFPDGSLSYRKVYMIFTLGTYNCPAGTQYCHEWDYTVTTYLMSPLGDTLELGRYITPYAGSGSGRYPSSWKKDYVWDITDYVQYLKDERSIRIFYSGYSAGFTANVRFAFIEGTPAREVKSVQKLWDGSYTYGKADDPIDNHITPKTLTAPDGTASSELKFTITGHGSDNNQCCEFLSRDYYVKLNSNTIATKSIWKDDCGVNHTYPQTGTWIYDRANWCPGEQIAIHKYALPSIPSGSNYNIDIDFQSYTAGNTNYGSYTNYGVVVNYGTYTHSLDAEISDIIAPTLKDEHFRKNPALRPVVVLRNNGSTTLTSALIRYGVKDSAEQVYNWTGSLASDNEIEITLPDFSTITNMSLNGISGTYDFFAEVAQANGTTDGESLNNKLTSRFAVAPTWDNDLVIMMKTNSEGVNGINAGPSETSWEILDMQGNVVFSRTDADVNTQYNDTISIGNKGYYQLKIKDGGCDGLQWWLWTQNPQVGITEGSFYIRRLGSASNLPMNGFYYGTRDPFRFDFGCEYTQYFTTEGWPLSVNETPKAGAHIDIYPNPAKSEVHILINSNNAKGSLISIADMQGRIINQMKAADGVNKINAGHLANGVYQVLYTNDNGDKITRKVVIAK